MDKIYNKLVRDKIPQIIEADGRRPVTRILDDDQYKLGLEEKLREECEEVIGADTAGQRLEELADLLEVISALAALEGETLEGAWELAQEKRAVRGGFEQRIFLEKVESDS